MKSFVNVLFMLSLLILAAPQGQMQTSPPSEPLSLLLQDENPATYYPVYDFTGRITHYLYHIQAGRIFQSRREARDCLVEAKHFLEMGLGGSEQTFKYPLYTISYFDPVVIIKAPGGRGPHVYDPPTLISFLNAIYGYEVQEFGDQPQRMKFDIIQVPDGYPGGNGTFAPDAGFSSQEVALV